MWPRSNFSNNKSFVARILEAGFEQDIRDGSLRAVMLLSRKYPTSARGHFEYAATFLGDKYGPPDLDRTDVAQPGGAILKGERSWIFPRTWILLQWIRLDETSEMLVIQYIPPPTIKNKRAVAFSMLRGYI